MLKLLQLPIYRLPLSACKIHNNCEVCVKALRFSTNINNGDETDRKKEEELARIAENASIDEPPTTCCMSGCANCVFIAWAEALSKKMKTSKPEVAEKILKLVEDPSLKAFLEMELRFRGLK